MGAVQRIAGDFGPSRGGIIDEDIPLSISGTRPIHATVSLRCAGKVHAYMAEIVSSRADGGKLHMGLTSWKGSPEGTVHASDVDKAKSYLAEDRAGRHVLTSMEDCDRLLDDFLRFNGRQVLDGQRTRRE